MHIDIWVIFLATSLILALVLYISRVLKDKRALERELSLFLKQKENLSNEIEKEKQELEKQKGEIREQILQEQKSQIDLLNESLEERRKQAEEDLEKIKASKLELIVLEVLETKEKMLANIKLDIEKSEGIAAQYKQKIIELEKVIEELKGSEEAIQQTWLRKAVEDNKYNLNLSADDLLEIKDIHSIAERYPRIRPILLKSIYEIYYAPEVKQLAARVLAEYPAKAGGIYRITSKVDGRLYIGRSVDFRQRWITHFKRAAGVETGTQNLLYPAMRKDGIHNFSFEVVEVVENEKDMPAREKYWQEFYKAKERGFSVK